VQQQKIIFGKKASCPSQSFVMTRHRPRLACTHLEQLLKFRTSLVHPPAIRAVNHIYLQVRSEWIVFAQTDTFNLGQSAQGFRFAWTPELATHHIKFVSAGSKLVSAARTHQRVSLVKVVAPVWADRLLPYVHIEKPSEFAATVLPPFLV
jgi:hypothetical protein